MCTSFTPSRSYRRRTASVLAPVRMTTSPEWLAVTVQHDGLCTQDAVHIKNNGSDGIQVVVYHILYIQNLPT